MRSRAWCDGRPDRGWHSRTGSRSGTGECDGFIGIIRWDDLRPRPRGQRASQNILFENCASASEIVCWNEKTSPFRNRCISFFSKFALLKIWSSHTTTWRRPADRDRCRARTGPTCRGLGSKPFQRAEIGKQAVPVYYPGVPIRATSRGRQLPARRSPGLRQPQVSSRGFRASSRSRSSPRFSVASSTA